MDSKINFKLSEIAHGAVQVKLDRAMATVTQNILDLNTAAKAKRKVTLMITIAPDETRSTAQIDVATKTTLAPEESVATTALLGKQNQQVVLNELKSGTPGQTFIDDDGDVKTDTGEPVGEAEKKIIDLQKKAGN